MKKHKNKIIFTAIVVAVLVLAFLWGGNNPGSKEDTKKEPLTVAVAKETEPAEEKTVPAETVFEEKTEEISEKPEEKTPEEVKKEEEPKETNEHTCTLSVRCDTILDNMDRLDEEKHHLVPENGIIFEEKSVVFYEGESVFNLLSREMKQNSIHLEFVNTPIYQSAYIEGINNIYEFDCGELSGWVYNVNGVFPNYGCSRYELKDNDRVEWLYTCNLGDDVGGYNFLEPIGE